MPLLNLYRFKCQTKEYTYQRVRVSTSLFLLNKCLEMMHFQVQYSTAVSSYFLPLNSFFLKIISIVNKNFKKFVMTRGISFATLSSQKNIFRSFYLYLKIR